MKKIALSIVLMFAGLAGYSTTWTITSPGFTFSPVTLTIMSGDDVNFDIDGIHAVVEVSQTTWNNNGNTPLPGGFDTPFGGGMVTASELTIGTHWYVCSPHSSKGMKGIIIVQNTTGTEESRPPANISIYPNPTSGKIQLLMESLSGTDHYDLKVFDMQGRKVYAESKLEPQALNEIDLSDQVKGLYYVTLFDGIEIYNRKIIVQ